MCVSIGCSFVTILFSALFSLLLYPRVYQLLVLGHEFCVTEECHLVNSLESKKEVELFLFCPLPFKFNTQN